MLKTMPKGGIIILTKVREVYTMRLVDVTKDNWEDVIFLSTNESITVKGSGKPYKAKGMPSLNKMLDDEELFKIVLE